MSEPARQARDALAILAVLTVAWQGAYEYAGAVAVTPPLGTVAFAAHLLGSARFWEHAAATGLALADAFAIAAVLGVLGGLALGLWRYAADVTEPVLAALYAVPKITLYPVILLLFGLGLPAKVAFGVIHGVIPVTLLTLSAVRGIRPVLLRTARVLRLTPRETMRHVLAPAVLAEIVTGLRLCFSLTLLGVLIGEMFASQRGLGFLIINGINNHDVRMTTAVVLLVVVAAVLANALLLATDRTLHRG